MDYSRMDILIFLFVLSNSILVKSDDNVAMESNGSVQKTYKVYPDPEDETQLNDQQAAESVPQTFGKDVGDSLKGYQVVSQNQVHDAAEKLQYSDEGNLNTQGVHNLQLVTQKTVAYLPQDLRQNEGFQHFSHPIYLQQYPHHPHHQIFGAEASPLHQINQHGHQKSSGYSSFVEHITEKDEEEIKSAMREGSVDDLKRLVPKSGISFKIYHNGKTGEVQHGGQSAVTEHSILPTKESVHEIGHNSNLHHRIKVEVPQVPLQIQTVHQQPLQEHQIYLQNHISDQHSENTQKSYQTIGQLQSQNAPPAFYSQTEDKSLTVKPPLTQFKINVQDEILSKPASTIEFSRNVNALNAAKLPQKSFAQTLQHKSHYNNHWNGKGEGLQKAIKPVKHIQKVKYQIDHAAQAGGVKNIQNGFSQASAVTHHPGGTFGHLTTHSYAESGAAKGDLKIVSHSQVNADATRATHNGLAGHVGYLGGQQNLAHHLTGNLYANNEQSHLLGLNAQAIKSNLGVQHSDSEAAKSSQYNIISNSYVDAKSSQNNFDHQKALEGSTSFDIKNAIGSTETHQTTGYIAPTTEIHPVEHLEKQQLTYVIPKIPTQSLLLSSIHENAGVDGLHQIKNLGYSPQLSYHTLPAPVVPEVTGKYFSQPQTISTWNAEQIKQANLLTANDLHQPLVRLHLPKEELVQQIKGQKLELPTSFVSQNSFTHQKQPFGAFHGKFQQEFHFQPKKNLELQNIRVNHPKSAPQLAIDWSLFKSQFPNFNINHIQLKPELLTYNQESTKKIVPILVRKRKNRSSKDTGVVYGKVNGKLRPNQPNQRHEKSVQFGGLQPQASNNINQYNGKDERKNEFSVSASYKVDRSYKNS